MEVGGSVEVSGGQGRRVEVGEVSGGEWRCGS